MLPIRRVKMGEEGLNKTLPDEVRTGKAIGRRLRLLREHYMLAQDEFAKRLLISRNLLSEIENGKRKPPGPLLVALEALFMTSRVWLLTGKREMIPDPKNGAGLNQSVSEQGAEDVVNLLKGYRSLSIENRKKLLNILRVFMVIEEKGGHA